MIALLDRIYGRILEGLVVLATNPVQCAAVWLVQIFVTTAVTILFFWIVMDVIATRRMIRRTSVLIDGRVDALLERMREAFVLRRRPTLRVTSNASPAVATAGYLKPSIVFSSRVLDELDDDEIHAVMCHELAHVEARDNLVTAFSRSLIVLFLTIVPLSWSLAVRLPHQGLHYGSLRAKLMGAAITMAILSALAISRRLVPVREMWCDDRAVAAGADPVALASAIVRVSVIQRRSRWAGRVPGAGLLPRSAEVERRILRLLDHAPRFRRRRFGRIVVTLILSVLVLYMAGYHMRAAISSKPPLQWTRIHPP